MPNAVAWANGDTIELPQHPANYALVGTWNMTSYWPAFGVSGPRLGFWGVPGQSTVGYQVENLAPSSLYTGGGGNLAAPHSAFKVVGPWQVGLDMNNYGPNVVGMYFEGQKWGTAGFVTPVVVHASTSVRGDYLRYYVPQKYWSFSVGTQNNEYMFADNVTGGGFTAPGHIGSHSRDAQGQVTITRGTSATVNFSVAFEHAPICTLTPTSDPSLVGAYWVTANTRAMTANVKVSGTITFNYTCLGNPN
jgi:hypothetical protein